MVVPLFVLAVLAFCPLVAVLVPLPDEFDAEFSLSGLGVGSGGDPLARLVARIPDAIPFPGIPSIRGLRAKTDVAWAN